MELRWLRPGDEEALVQASPLFDDEIPGEGARRFLDSPGHHLCLALTGGRAVGFVSGVELTHPDKGTEMFLYELGVEEESRRRGVGRALVGALARRARESGCYGMWVLTDADNEAALGTYRAAGAGPPSPHVMLDWSFEPGDEPES